MTLLQTCFESSLQECISSLNVIVNSTLTTTANELVLAAAAADQISPDRKSVAKMQFLPDLNKCNLPNGTMIYVENIYTYVLSYNKCWIGLDGRLFNNNCRNELWTWGSNCHGVLGIGSSATLGRCSPVREFCSANDWCSVTAGRNHMTAIKSNGQLWTWGRNQYGELGDGTTITRCSPVREFCSATDWCQVSSFNNTVLAATLAVKTTGQIWGWGNNSSGLLGDGTTTSRCSPVREFCSANDWCQVSAGSRFSVALKTTGQIWAWGFNYGTLGNGNTTCTCSPVREFCSASDWCAVDSRSANHTAALKTSGQLWVWGVNANGQLGLGTNNTLRVCSPVREFCSASDWCFISVRDTGSFAIKSSGQLWAWGFNSVTGQLGDGTTNNSASPIREFCSATDWFEVSGGGNHTMALKNNGQLWTWGRNFNYGHLGIGTTTSSCSPVREFTSSSDWSQVSAGECSSAAIKVIRNI